MTPPERADGTLETGRIVTVDPFIYGASDHFFINANWLSQALMAALFDRFGWIGLFALRVGLVVCAFAFVIAIARRLGADASGIAWTVLAAGLGAYERFSMRPELFSYAIMMAQLWLLLRGVDRWTTRIGVPLLQAAWVNLHSYFLIGPAITLCLGAGRLFCDSNASRQERRRTFVQWMLVLGAQTLACLANPWGLAGMFFPLRTLGYLRATHAMGHAVGDPSGPWGVLSEFQSPFGFLRYLGASRPIYAYLVLLALSAGGVAVALHRRAWGIALVIALMALMSTQMRRNIAQFALVASPLAIGQLAGRRDGAATDPTSADPARASPAGAWSARRRAWVAAQALTVLLTGWWLIGLWSGQFYYDERRPGRRLAAGWSDYIFPFDAIDWLNHQPVLRPRLFADLMLSSNVLPWLRPDLQVMIDTNTFAYPPEQLMRVWNVGIGREAHQRLLDEYGVNVAMVRAQDATLPLLRSLAADSAWALVWFDRYVAIFARRIPEHEALIREHEKSRSFLDVPAWIAAAPRSHEITAFRLCGMTNVPFALGWFDVAGALYGEVLRLDPRCFEAWNNLGVCHNKLGMAHLSARRFDDAMAEFKQARSCFENCLRIDPRNAEARYNLDATPVEFLFDKRQGG